MTQDLTAELIRFLGRRFPALGEPLGDATPLMDTGAIDSLGILEIVGFLDDQFGIQIDDDDFEPANFATVRSLVALVERKVNA